MSFGSSLLTTLFLLVILYVQTMEFVIVLSDLLVTVPFPLVLFVGFELEIDLPHLCRLRILIYMMYITAIVIKSTQQSHNVYFGFTENFNFTF